MAKRKQQLAEALAKEAAGIDIAILAGDKKSGQRPARPQTLSPEEQKAREQTFNQRFTVTAAPKESLTDTLSSRWCRTRCVAG